MTKPIPINTDKAELNRIKIPLADLRMQIVQLMKDGFTEVPLGELLYLIQETYRRAKTEK